MRLFIDTATTGLWNFKAGPYDKGQPHMIRLAYRGDSDSDAGISRIIRPFPDWQIEAGAIQRHKITPLIAQDWGFALGTVLHNLTTALNQVSELVAHSAPFHQKVLIRAYGDAQLECPDVIRDKTAWYCTMNRSRDIVRTRLIANGQWAWPALHAAYSHFVGENMPSMVDPVTDGTNQIKAVREVYLGIVAT